MRVLVTGATGFIGKNMVEGLLKNGYEVTCVSRRKIAKDTFKKPVKNIVLDLQEIEKIEKYMEDIDVIIRPLRDSVSILLSGELFGDC